ncbi:MAG: MFS transporter [Eggerthellaceae bacterium]|nr:MFS transporter [Eggerthellaceae bacterium]
MGLTRQQVLQVAVLLFGCLLSELNYTLLAPALPVIMGDMRVGETDVQWLMSVYALVEAVVIPLNAFFLGRFTTRRLFAGSFLLFAAGSAVIAAGPSFAWLIAGRALQAFATGVVITMSTTLVLITVPREGRGRMMGLLGLVISFAPAIGAPASGGLVDVVGWRALLVGVAVIAAVLAAVGAACLRDHEGFERTGFDVPSVVLSSAGMVAFLYGVSTVTDTEAPWASALLMVAGAGFIAAFVRRQSRLESPMLRVETFRTRRFRNAVILCCLMEAALLAIDVLLPLLLEDSLGASPTVTGFAMMPAALVGAAAGVVSGRLFDKHGVRRVAVPGVVVLLGSAAGLCFVGLDTSVVLVAGLYMVETLGWQMVSTPVNTWGINSLPDDVIQHGTAVLDTLMQVGAAFGTAAIVSLTALAPGIEGYRLGFAGCAALLAVVAVMVFAAIRDR